MAKRSRFRGRRCSCSDTTEPKGPGRPDVAGVRSAHSAGPLIAPPRSTSRTGSGVPPFSRHAHGSPPIRDRAPSAALGWPLWCLLFASALVLQGCTNNNSTPVQRVAEPRDGFCDQDDTLFEQYLVAVNVAGWTSASGVATVHDSTLVVLTNRHNLPPDPDLSLVSLRNHRFAVTRPSAIITAGRPLVWKGLTTAANDFVMLAVREPEKFKPLPMALHRHHGAVVVPNFSGRRYSVQRGTQTADAAGHDRLDFALSEGASGAPVLTCQGEIVGLYTARIVEEDWRIAGFKGVATPITAISGF